MGEPTELGPSSGPADILLLGPEELTPAGIRRSQSWRAQHPASLLIAVVPRGSLTTAELGGLGVNHVIQGKFSEAKAVKTLLHAVEQLDRLAQEASEWRSLEQVEVEEVDVSESIIEDAKQPREPVLVSIASPTGGSGKTFYACNLAGALAAVGLKVLIVDLDLQFGEVAVGLRLQHPYSIYDGLYDSRGTPLPVEALAEHVDELVCHHELGFDVLTAPKNPELADYIGAADAARVLDVVVPRYEVIIADTPPSLNEVVLTVLDRSDLVVVLATPDVPSLKNLGVFLDTLHRLQVVDSHIQLILNKVESDIGLDVKEIQGAFSDRFVGFIPQSRIVSRALNTGKPIVAFAPRSDVGVELMKSFAAVFPSEALRMKAPKIAGKKKSWNPFARWRRKIGTKGVL